MLLVVVAGFLAGLIALGQWSLEQIRQRERYTVFFGDIDCTPPAGMDRPSGPGDAGAAMASDPGSMIFTVVEALGLKLESGKEPVETLVIDHIDKPTAN